MLSLISLIVIITLSILVTKIATIMLNHTGLSRQSASFQARSAFTGVGFTTTEAEKVVGHPVRRKIIMTLMLIGNAGIISVMATVILTFFNTGQGGFGWPLRLGIIVVSIIILWILANSRVVDRWLGRVINKMLRRFTDLNVRDYARLLHLSGEYEITELKVEKGHWMAGKELQSLGLRHEGINLLGIKREDGTFIGTPQGNTRIEAGDNLITYGRELSLRSLDERRKGMDAELKHKKAVKKQQLQEKKEKKQAQKKKFKKQATTSND